MSTVNRANTVIIDFRSANPGFGVRPALVLQNDNDNARMTNTIVAQITSNTRRAGEKTQLLIDSSHLDWSASALRNPSVVNCSNLATVEQVDVVRIIGSVSDKTMLEVAECLKAALDIT